MAATNKWRHKSLSMAMVLGLFVLGAVLLAACGSAGRTATSASATVKSVTTAASPYAVAPDQYHADIQANTSGSCQFGADSGAYRVVGFAIITRNADGTITADVTMEHGAPNYTYTVELIQHPNAITNAPYCGEPYSPLVTDAHGHGTTHLSVQSRPGTSGASVHIVNTESSLDPLGTQAVHF